MMLQKEDIDYFAPYCGCGKQLQCGVIGDMPAFVCVSCSFIGVASQEAIDSIVERAIIRANQRHDD